MKCVTDAPEQTETLKQLLSWTRNYIDCTLVWNVHHDDIDSLAKQLRRVGSGLQSCYMQ